MPSHRRPCRSSPWAITKLSNSSSNSLRLLLHQSFSCRRTAAISLFPLLQRWWVIQRWQSPTLSSYLSPTRTLSQHWVTTTSLAWANAAMLPFHCWNRLIRNCPSARRHQALAHPVHPVAISLLKPSRKLSNSSSITNKRSSHRPPASRGCSLNRMTIMLKSRGKLSNSSHHQVTAAAAAETVTKTRKTLRNSTLLLQRSLWPICPCRKWIYKKLKTLNTVLLIMYRSTPNFSSFLFIASYLFVYNFFFLSFYLSSTLLLYFRWNHCLPLLPARCPFLSKYCTYHHVATLVFMMS